MKTALELDGSQITDSRIFRPEVIPAFDEEDMVTLEGEKLEARFAGLTVRQKCFQVMFYALSALTSVLVVQVIWQIAVLTAK